MPPSPPRSRSRARPGCPARTRGPPPPARSPSTDPSRAPFRTLDRRLPLGYGATSPQILTRRLISARSPTNTEDRRAALERNRHRAARHGRHAARPALRQLFLAGSRARALCAAPRAVAGGGPREPRTALRRQAGHARLVLHRFLESRAVARRRGAEARSARARALPAGCRALPARRCTRATSIRCWSRTRIATCSKSRPSKRGWRATSGASSARTTSARRKNTREFWTQLQAQLAFDPARCLFVDDSIAVLNAARAHGIGQIFAISRPDSTQHARTIEGFATVERIEELLDVTFAG